MASLEANPAPLTTSTTTILSPFPTSSSPQQPGAFFSGGASASLIAGLVSIGAFAVAVISICAWRRSCRHRHSNTFMPDSVVDRILPARFTTRRRRRWAVRQQGREGEGERGRSNELGKAKPEMFDVWIEEGRSLDILKWEDEESESMVPFSATVFTTGSLPPPPPPTGQVETAAVSMGEVSSRAGRGRDSVDEEDHDEEKRCFPVQMREAAATGSSTLQVAVLLQMPSPPSHTVTGAQNDISVRGELAIGLVEVPWTREHPSSRGGERTTTS